MVSGTSHYCYRWHSLLISIFNSALTAHLLNNPILYLRITMPKTSRHNHFQPLHRSLRHYISDFLHLFTSARKGIYSWSEILLGLLIIGFLITLAFIAAS